MKKIIFFIVVITGTVNLRAQKDIILNFAASGTASSYDSIIVQNINRNTQVTVYNNESLKLVYDPTGYRQINKTNDKINTYPNPVTDFGILEFTTKSSGFINIEIYDIMGRKLIQQSDYLQEGLQRYRIEGLNKGAYTIQVNTATGNLTTRLISVAEKAGHKKISFFDNIQSSEASSKLKKGNDMPFLGYIGGDGFLLWAYAGQHSLIVHITPDGDTIVPLIFEACFDYQGNGYPVVTIGSQKWMGANLRTQFYNNGAGIATTNPPTRDISEDTEPKFSWQYGDNGGSDFSFMHGRLYTWYVVTDSNGICPIGWHVPTLDDWLKLFVFLQQNGYNYDKTIDTSSVYLGTFNKTANSMTPWWTWHQTSIAEPGAPGANCCYNVRNRSGFTAFASGYRTEGGGFGAMGTYTRWWTSTMRESNRSPYFISIWHRNAYVSLSNYLSAKHGYSVRCVKD